MILKVLRFCTVMRASPYDFTPVSRFDETERHIYASKNEYPLQFGLKIAFKNGIIVYKVISF